MTTLDGFFLVGLAVSLCLVRVAFWRGWLTEPEPDPSADEFLRKIDAGIDAGYEPIRVGDKLIGWKWKSSANGCITSDRDGKREGE